MNQQLNYNIYIFLIYCFFKLNYVYSRKFKVQLMNDEDILPKNTNCEEIKIDYCKNLDYKKTILPISQNKDKIIENLSELELILKSNCSSYLQLFICSNFLPPCLHKLLRPCKEFCLKVKEDCVQILNKKNYEWPHKLDCNNFPKNDPCFKPNFKIKQNSNKCPIELRKPLESGYQIQLKNFTLKECALPCNNFIHTEQDVNSIRNFIGLLSLFCILITILSIFTFLIDEKKFTFPFRVFVYISCSYFVISTIYFVAYLSKDRIACIKSDLPYLETSNQNFQKIVSLPINQVTCKTVFILNYFFTIYSATWWFILGIICILEVFFMWANEVIKNLSKIFNFIAFIISLSLTIVTLMKASIYGNTISGLCSIHIYDEKIFLFLPLTFFLTFGTLFIVFSLYYYYFQLKPILRMLDNLLKSKRYFRKLFFAILFIFAPFLLRLSCFLYEYLNYEEWTHNWYRNVCNKTPNDQEFCSKFIHEKQIKKPSLVIVYIKYFSIFLPSFISIILVFNRKSSQIWLKYISKIKSICLDKKDKLTHL